MDPPHTTWSQSDVTGTITLRLKHVPWHQALGLIARTRNLDLERDGNVILVRTPDTRSHVGFAGARPVSDH